MSGARDPSHTHQAAPRLDQRLRRAFAADDSHRTLAGGLSPALLHEPSDARPQPSPVHAVLQLRATASWLPRPGPHAGDHFPWRHGGSPLSSCTLWDGESVNTKPSLDTLGEIRLLPVSTSTTSLRPGG